MTAYTPIQGKAPFQVRSEITIYAFFLTTPCLTCSVHVTFALALFWYARIALIPLPMRKRDFEMARPPSPRLGEGAGG